MNVVVTGGSGLVGKHIIRSLVQDNHHVLNVDRIRPRHNLSPYQQADLEDLGQVYECLKGAEAVIHLAALHLGMATDEVVLRTNVMSTYNIIEAASNLGASRIVMASSMSVLGYPSYYHRFALSYAPVDEIHPLLPQDPYALSKVLGEETAQSFVRRNGLVLTGSLSNNRPGYHEDAFVRRNKLTIVGLRLAWIVTPDSFKKQVCPLQNNEEAGASILWCYVDVRDVARACMCALVAEIEGFEAFFVAAPDSFMEIPTVELIQRYYPETEIRHGLENRSSILSTGKASRLLDHQAEYTWDSY